MKTVLITSICGSIGRRLAARLARQWRVTGTHHERAKTLPHGAEVAWVDPRKRAFEQVLRRHCPAAIVHLGFERDFDGDLSARHDLNVRGTQRLLQLGPEHGVERLVVVSSATVYGALPENPHRLREDAPLSASRSYPEIRDQVELDSLATAFLWQRAEVATSVLRPVHVLGPTAHSMAARYLRQPRVPTVLGFDPMMQFIHEEDCVEAIATALDAGLRGVFNVTGAGEVPVHTAIHESGASAWPLPEPLARAAFGAAFRVGAAPFPPGMLEYLKYPATVSGERFVEATGFEPQRPLRETFDDLRRAAGRGRSAPWWRP